MATKTKAELLEEIEVRNGEIKKLKKEIEKLDRYKQYEDAGDGLFAMRESFLKAGFTRAEAFEMTKMILAGCMSKAFGRN